MNKVKQVVASALVIPMLFTGVAAAAAGQVEGGDIYRVRNVTKNTDFTDPASADLCETVQFKVRIHNPGPDPLTGVRVKATLNTEVSASHSSTVTISANNANPSTTTDTAGVNLSKAAGMSYVAGSTELLDAHNSKLSNLPDGILGGGVEVTNGVGVSTEQKRFVQFQAKVDCPPTNQPVYSCDAFSITAGDNRTVKISGFSTTAKDGATFKRATVNFGDNSALLNDANIIGKSHQYAADGTYTVTATPYFDVNGKEVSASSPNCVQNVTFKSGQPPVVTPPSTPVAAATLPNTGAGSTLAIAGAATVLGAALYRRRLARSLSE